MACVSCDISFFLHSFYHSLPVRFVFEAVTEPVACVSCDISFVAASLHGGTDGLFGMDETHDFDTADAERANETYGEEFTDCIDGLMH